MGNFGAEEIIQELPTALYRWYPFEKGSRLLYVGEADAVFSMLSKSKDLTVQQATNIEKTTDLAEWIGDGVDYVVLSPETVECSKDLQGLFAECFSNLRAGGILLFGMRNRLGIRYFAGDEDPYTGRNMDGLEDYARVNLEQRETLKGRCLDAAKIETALSESRLTISNRFSIYPGLENPALLCASDYLPKETLNSRIFPQYLSNHKVFLEEQRMYDSLVENNLFHQMANAYLYECRNESCSEKTIGVGTETTGILASDALQVTSSLDRGPEQALITVIHSNETVTKQAAYPEACKRLQLLHDNMEKLKALGIPVVDSQLEDGVFTMPYIDAETGEQYLKRLLESDVDAYLEKMDEFHKLVKKSAEGGEAFVDLVPLNCFAVDGKFIFFDQEICLRDFPADLVMHRVIQIAHDSGILHESRIPKAELFHRYGLPDGINGPDAKKYFDMDQQVMNDLRHDDLLEDYHKRTRVDWQALWRNRWVMNYSGTDYDRLSADVFTDLEDKKLILFGSGRYARMFFTRYGSLFTVDKVLDNNQARWGQRLYAEGYDTGESTFVTDELRRQKSVEIVGPQYLNDLYTQDYKVIVCMKDCAEVVRQLQTMGIEHYAVYNPSWRYEIPQVVKWRIDKENSPEEGNTSAEKTKQSASGAKKYHIGYTAGAFDLFHMGHLNLLRRSKEMCDYLIVGVMTDEAIQDYKGKAPFVTFAERMELLKACKYVDEVVEIPYRRGESDEAWNLYHFDVQFCGTDYIGNEGRMKEKAFLEEHGAVLEMFPYTESVSSSKLQELIRQNLI